VDEELNDTSANWNMKFVEKPPRNSRFLRNHAPQPQPKPPEKKPQLPNSTSNPRTKSTHIKYEYMYVHHRAQESPVETERSSPTGTAQPVQRDARKWMAREREGGRGGALCSTAEVAVAVVGVVKRGEAKRAG